MYRMLAALSLAFLSVAAIPVHAAVDVVGTYGCSGVDGSGQSYTAELVIEAEGDSFNLTWTLPSGSVNEGIGIVTNDVLSVIFTNGDSVGLVSYAISKTALNGTWKAPGAMGEVLTETCTAGGQARTV